ASLTCLKDPPRKGEKLTLSPSGTLAAITDSLGRILLLDTQALVVVRLWKGYRDANCLFMEMLVKKDSASTSYHEYKKSDYCLCLAIHAPRKGIIEVWQMRTGPRLLTIQCAKGNACPNKVQSHMHMLVERLNINPDQTQENNSSTLDPNVPIPGKWIKVTPIKKSAPRTRKPVLKLDQGGIIHLTPQNQVSQICVSTPKHQTPAANQIQLHSNMYDQLLATENFKDMLREASDHEALLLENTMSAMSSSKASEFSSPLFEYGSNLPLGTGLSPKEEREFF
ncbi:hypothetical protein SOVF_161340, partial [Spinacia oleracea]